jgi:hypothetical protein
VANGSVDGFPECDDEGVLFPAAIGIPMDDGNVGPLLSASFLILLFSNCTMTVGGGVVISGIIFISSTIILLLGISVDATIVCCLIKMAADGPIGTASVVGIVGGIVFSMGSVPIPMPLKLVNWPVPETGTGVDDVDALSEAAPLTLLL